MARTELVVEVSDILRVHRLRGYIFSSEKYAPAFAAAHTDGIPTKYPDIPYQNSSSS